MYDSNQVLDEVIKTDVMSKRSVIQFIERQNKGKLIKQAKEQYLNRNDGSNWKNEVTKPNPPKITDILIQNLQKKLNENNQKLMMQTTCPTPKSQRQQPISLRIKGDEVKKQQFFKRALKDSSNSSMGILDEEVMIFEEDRRKVMNKTLEFKEAVKFLRESLHQLDLDM